MGLISQSIRWIKRQIRALFDQVFGRFRRKSKKGELEIPGSWIKEPESPMTTSPEPMERRPSSLQIRRGKYRIRWLLTFKRLMAALLLFINLVLSGFMLSIQNSGAAVLCLMFLGNAFLLADYLWKTGSVQKK